jgi:hypothetical protein
MADKNCLRIPDLFGVWEIVSEKTFPIYAFKGSVVKQRRHNFSLFVFHSSLRP